VLAVNDAGEHWLEHMDRKDRQRLHKTLQSLANRKFEPGKRQRLIEQLEQAQQAFGRWQMEQFEAIDN
jgi:NADH:ubiquinone oxidoreductase subunit E